MLNHTCVLLEYLYFVAFVQFHGSWCCVQDCGTLLGGVLSQGKPGEEGRVCMCEGRREGCACVRVEGGGKGVLCEGWREEGRMCMCEG